MPERVPLFVIELANDRNPTRTAVAVGRVDLSSWRFHIPRAVAVRLGLSIDRAVGINVFRTGRQDADLAKDCRITVCGRSTVLRAVVEPDGDTCALGFGPLAVLGLSVDQKTRLPVPNDSNQRVIDI